MTIVRLSIFIAASCVFLLAIPLESAYAKAPPALTREEPRRLMFFGDLLTDARVRLRECRFRRIELRQILGTNIEEIGKYNAVLLDIEWKDHSIYKITIYISLVNEVDVREWVTLEKQDDDPDYKAVVDELVNNR